MKKYLEVLQGCPLFRGIQPEDLSAMLACLEPRVVRAARHQPILREGEPAVWVGILLSGQAQVVREDYDGNRTILTQLEPGALFGESFACAEVPALPESVTAVAPAEAMLLDCRRITASCCNACTFHSAVVFNLLKVVAAKNLRFHEKLEITSKRTTRERLMTYLLAQAKAHNSRQFVIPFDRQALADYLSVDRSGLSSEISKLRAEGVLDCCRSSFTLL